MVGLDLRGLFQAKQYCDTMIWANPEGVEVEDLCVWVWMWL